MSVFSISIQFCTKVKASVKFLLKKGRFESKSYPHSTPDKPKKTPRYTLTQNLLYTA